MSWTLLGRLSRGILLPSQWSPNVAFHEPAPNVACCLLWQLPHRVSSIVPNLLSKNYLSSFILDFRTFHPTFGFFHFFSNYLTDKPVDRSIVMLMLPCSWVFFIERVCFHDIHKNKVGSRAIRSTKYKDIWRENLLAQEHLSYESIQIEYSSQKIGQQVWNIKKHWEMHLLVKLFAYQVSSYCMTDL